MKSCELGGIEDEGFFFFFFQTLKPSTPSTVGVKTGNWTRLYVKESKVGVGRWPRSRVHPY